MQTRGASISSVARRHGIGMCLLFRWKQELTAPAPEPLFLPVTISDADQTGATPQMTSTPGLPRSLLNVLFRRSEVELRGGRRVRFGRDVDPETVRSLIAVLEASAQSG